MESCSVILSGISLISRLFILSSIILSLMESHGFHGIALSLCLSLIDVI